MSPLQITIAVLVPVVLYQGYITARVLRGDVYSSAQKTLQLALVWLLPLLGAAITHAFFASEKELPTRPDEHFTPQSPNDGGGSGVVGH